MVPCFKPSVAFQRQEKMPVFRCLFFLNCLFFKQLDKENKPTWKRYTEPKHNHIMLCHNYDIGGTTNKWVQGKEMRFTTHLAALGELAIHGVLQLHCYQ